MKSLLPSKEQIPLFMTLAAVLLLGLGYYYVYVPKSENQLREWKFRTLQNIGKNIHDKIENSQTLLQNYLDHPSLEMGRLNDLNKSLDSLSRVSKLHVSPITSLTGNEKKKSSVYDSLSKKLTVTEELTANDKHNLVIHISPKIDTNPVAGKRKSTPRISINRENQLIMTEKDVVVANSELAKKADSLQINLRYDFKSFIEPLLPKKIFDHYIIIGENQVLYQDFLSGLENSSDSLLLDKSNITSATIRDKTFAGVDFKLFLQPVAIGETRLVVIGLLSAQNYRDGITKLPAQFVLFLILIFTGILITIPIIKLYQLDHNDRLTPSDVLSCTVVCMFMISLFFFSFLKLRSIHIRQEENDPKTKLAKAISAAFIKEIRSNVEKLVRLDQLMAGLSRRPNLFNLKQVSASAFKGQERQRRKSEIANEIHGLVEAINLERVFWMNSKGRDTFNWKSGPVAVHFPGNFEKREYFNAVKRRDGLDISVPSASVVQIEQVVSWVSATFLTAISIDSKVTGMTAAVMSFTVESLDQARLPPGYQFAMIDKVGKVLYHSDKTKNLNENFLSELSEKEEVEKHIRTGKSKSFKSSYFGQEYKMRIQAVGAELPYYIVIMDRLSFEDARDVDVYSFTFSMQMLLLVLVLTQMLILFFATARRSRIRVQAFDTSWLSPKKSSHQVYIITALFNVLTFLAVVLYPYSSVIGRLFTLMISVSVMPVFLNLAMAIKYYASDKKLSSHKRIAALWSSIVPFIVNIIATATLEEAFSDFLFFELKAILEPACVILVCYALFLWWNKSRTINGLNLKKEITGENFNWSFASLVFSWMLIVNGLPIIIFFTAVYNYDQHLIARYKQLQLAANVYEEHKRKVIEGRESAKMVRSGMQDPHHIDSLSNAFYKDSFWVAVSEVLPDSTKKNVTGDSTLKDDETTIAILKSFHIKNGDEDGQKMDLNDANALDLYFFNNLMKQVNSQADQTKTIFRLKKHDKSLHIASAGLNFSLPSVSVSSGCFMWAAFLVLLAGLFFLVHHLIKKIFVLRLPVSGWDTFDNDVLSNNTQSNHIFVVTLPGSEDIFLPQHYIPSSSQGNTVHRLDMSLIPGKDFKKGADRKWNSQFNEALTNKYGLIVIDHFEYNFRDAYTSSVKLAALEQVLHSAAGSRLIILSTIRPATLISVLTEPDALLIDKHSTEKWQDLMGKFHIVIRKLVYSEAWRRSGLTEAEEESLLFKSQTSSYHYFFSIWQSLSREEKFLLYDLAEDGLVNASDKNTLCLLINKGVILREDGAMRLFCQGFRNFVLTGIGHMETEKIMDKVNDHRNWNKIKIPLALISLAILAFILSSQQETSTKLITTLGALAAVVPTIINFLATMGGTSIAKKA